MSKFDAKKSNVEKRVKKIKGIKKQGKKEKILEEQERGEEEEEDMGIEKSYDLVGLKREYLVKSEEGEIPKERIDLSG